MTVVTHDITLPRKIRKKVKYISFSNVIYRLVSHTSVDSLTSFRRMDGIYKSKMVYKINLSNYENTYVQLL